MRGIAKFVVGLTSALILLSQAWAGTITYYHNDLTGSPVAATNEAGQVLWREVYRPYGERLTNSPAAIDNDVWFTSRRQDETGLVYMGARYYDPVIGRFVSTDPKGFDADNLHSHNRYAYANNNPYKFVDRNGMAPTPFDAAFVLYDAVMLAHAAATDGDVRGAATDLGISVGAIFVPIPGAALAIKLERAAEAVRAAEITTEVLARKSIGRDGAESVQIIERQGEAAISRTHSVTKDGEVIHQHQNHVGKSGSERQFPDEWTGTKTIDAPYESRGPSFGPDRVPGGR